MFTCVVYYRSLEIISKIFAIVSAKFLVNLIAGLKVCKQVSKNYFLFVCMPLLMYV